MRSLNLWPRCRLHLWLHSRLLHSCAVGRLDCWLRTGLHNIPLGRLNQRVRLQKSRPNILAQV